MPESTENVAPSSAPRQIKRTARIGRGLSLVRSLLVIACSDDAPSVPAVVRRLRPAAVAELNDALAWIEQEYPSDPPTGPFVASCGSAARTRRASVSGGPEAPLSPAQAFLAPITPEEAS